eukprot:gnl/Chilomastix_cuspidata/4741.p1 GENE.gnl/Chilomastix_cuspidata/4741~~gnl/Chilomastix_cuspidata/4741.p1  ORF type:complete len:223 (+),score=9.63 gnl/Chilomastix_cuspidata/4741:290-958(+)
MSFKSNTEDNNLVDRLKELIKKRKHNIGVITKKYGHSACSSQCHFSKNGICLLIGPPHSGKSYLLFNYIIPPHKHNGFPDDRLHHLLKNRKLRRNAKESLKSEGLKNMKISYCTIEDLIETAEKIAADGFFVEILDEFLKSFENDKKYEKIMNKYVSEIHNKQYANFFQLEDKLMGLLADLYEIEESVHSPRLRSAVPNHRMPPRTRARSHNASSPRPRVVQ